jgi:hypothetical protein
MNRGGDNNGKWTKFMRRAFSTDYFAVKLDFSLKADHMMADIFQIVTAILVKCWNCLADLTMGLKIIITN